MTNLLLFLVIAGLAYFVYKSLNISLNREGMTSDTPAAPSNNGVAGSAANYAANIKAKVIKLQDSLLISKYRPDYENAIMSLDDLVNNLMLTTTLTIDPLKPIEGLEKLVKLQQSKVALNGVMKFVDSK